MSRIEDYALLGDLQTAALVSTSGSIDWLCLPKFDSPACFAALLDTPDAAHWTLAPASAGTCTARRYTEDTLVLETEWRSHQGTVRVIDFMPPRGHAPDVVRIVEGIHGSVAMRSELRLRFDYGRVVPWVRHHGDRMEAIAGPDRVRLRTPAPFLGEELSTVSEFTVRAGDRVPFVLTWNPSHETATQTGRRRRRPARHPDVLGRLVTARHAGARSLQAGHQKVAAHVESPDLPTHRWHRRRRDDIPAGTDRWAP